jgi:hypothetical protein
MISNKINMPIPAPGRTAAVTAGGLGVKVGVIVDVLVKVGGICVKVGVKVNVGEDVYVEVVVGLAVHVALGGTRVALGVLRGGTLVGQGMGLPAESTQPACALTYEEGSTSREPSAMHKKRK